MIHGQAFDEHGARVGIQDGGELRVQASGGLTGGTRRTRSGLYRVTRQYLEFVPVGMAHPSLAKGREPSQRRPGSRRF
jgi:hypothetical protein